MIRFLGRGNIADAWEIVENTDVLCFIQIEKERATGKYYLSFKRAKIRYKDIYDVSSFSHPFDGENKMRLMDDLYLDESLSKTSLASDFDTGELLNSKGKRTATEREEIEESTLFDFSKALNNKK